MKIIDVKVEWDNPKWKWEYWLLRLGDEWIEEERRYEHLMKWKLNSSNE